MRVAIAVIDLHIPSSCSLKAKRQVVKSLVQRLRQRFNLSVTEVGSQDLWQRSELGLAVVCHNGPGADSILQQIYSYIEEDTKLEIISTKVEIY